MKIAFCSIGSRGDIQPFLVLGDYFARKGHEVRVASAGMYAETATNYQVEYVAFEGDYAMLMDDDKMKATIGKNPFTLQRKLKEMVYPILENSLVTFYEQLEWADIVIYHPKVLLDAIGMAHQDKLVKAYVVPAFTPTHAFRSPLLEFLPLPRFLNKLTYKLTNAMMNTVKTPIQNFKKNKGITQKKTWLETPMIYGISSAFLAQPRDYPDNHIFTGFWMKSSSKASDIEFPVRTFLETHKPKVIITFGSMPYKSAIPIQNFIDGLRAAMDIRVLVVRAWGLKQAEIQETDDVMTIHAAPFNQLFPMADAVVHHGGAGTTAIALKSGIPQLICPVLHPVGDQLFWGRQVVRKGVGVEPIPLAKLKVNTLVASVEKLLKADFSTACKAMVAGIASEDGLERAYQEVMRFVKIKSV